MTEEQAEKDAEHGQDELVRGTQETIEPEARPVSEMKDVLARARKVLLRNTLVKIRDGKSLTAKETELIEEAEKEAEIGASEIGGSVGKETFKNVREVVAYLKGQDWKVSQATIYKHQNEGKIKAEADGTYLLKSVLRYARGFLMLRQAKQKVDDEELQRKKTKAEIWRTEEQAKLGRIKRMVEEGRYILRDQFELELAARAAALEAALMFMVQAKAGDWIRMVAGNHQKTQDLINDMTEAHNDTLNEFASDKEFHVLFDVKDGSRPTKDRREERESDGSVGSD
jgi:hypothetical protein